MAKHSLRSSSFDRRTKSLKFSSTHVASANASSNVASSGSTEIETFRPSQMKLPFISSHSPVGFNLSSISFGFMLSANAPNDRMAASSFFHRDTADLLFRSIGLFVDYARVSIADDDSTEITDDHDCYESEKTQCKGKHRKSDARLCKHSTAFRPQSFRDPSQSKRRRN